MDLFTIALILTTLLCSLVTGFLFGFALIAMPGIGKLKDGEFIRAFQEMDGIIQNNHPLFIIVWLGSVLAFIAALILGLQSLEGLERILLIASSAVYFFGLQLPTITMNVPLNNLLQTYAIESMTEEELKQARVAFEKPWNQWNVIRTVFGVISCVLLYTLLLFV